MFRDARADDAFSNLGFVPSPALAAGDLDLLRNAYEDVAADHEGAFAATLLHPSAELRRQVFEWVSPVLQQLMDRAVSGYRCVYAGFAVKGGAAETGPMPMHQDITMMDECQGAGLNLWIPLVDVCEQSGCLHMAPGTHRFREHPRAPGTPFLGRELEGSIRERHLIPLPMRAGQGVIFDLATFHCSGPNGRAGARPAAAGVFIPIDRPVLYVTRAGGRVTRHHVPDAYYLTNGLGASPGPNRVMDQRPEWTASLTANDLLDLPSPDAAAAAWSALVDT